jgi:hypothetical protein
MSEARHPDDKPTEESDQPVQKLRTNEPQAPFGADEPNPAVVRDDDAGGDDDAGDDEGSLPGLGGYEGRDPKKDMPRIPTVPKTQDDG